MARSNLKVSTCDLLTAGRGLRRVHAELSRADAHADDAAQDVGHPELAEALRDFSRNWDDRRAKMVASVEALAEQATTVGRTFEEIETSLVAALQGKA